MTVTPGDLPPPLDVRPDAQFWIDTAACEIDQQKWICAGVDVDKGIKLLASHHLTATPGGAGVVAGGVTTNEARGGVSIAVKTGAAADGPHGSTEYGQAFDALQLRVNTKRRRYLPPRPQPSC